MFNHAPKDYVCPFCKIAQGLEDTNIFTRQQDVFYRDKFITAFVSSHWWPNNRGSIIIIPNRHIENIYSLPDTLSCKIHAFERRVAIAFKRLFHCDGVSSRQHNEPAGNQEIWHYHLHVFPRYSNDNLYLLHKHKQKITEAERLPFALKLKEYFQQNKLC